MILLPEELQNFPVPVKIYVENRASARISLRDKQILIRLPKRMNHVQKQQALEELLRWAKDTIAKKQLYLKRAVDKYGHGSLINLLGTPHEIQHLWTAGNRMQLHITHDHILKLSLPEKLMHQEAEKRDAIRHLLINGLSKYHHPSMLRRVTELNREHFNASVSKVSLRYTISRWGSCSTSGAISLSTKLLLTPPEVCDYVIIHELAHRFEMNHSVRFWALVEKAMPEYQQHRNWLKTHGRHLDF